MARRHSICQRQALCPAAAIRSFELSTAHSTDPGLVFWRSIVLPGSVIESIRSFMLRSVANHGLPKRRPM